MAKVTINIGWLILFALLLIAATYLLTDYFNEPSKTITVKPRKDYDIITLKLPNSTDPDVFGSDYWKARHFLANMTPCPSCRAEAVSHEIFFHDIVNAKTGKKLFNQENYDGWIKRLCETKEKKNVI